MRKTPYLVTTAALPRPPGQAGALCGPPFLPLSSSSSSKQYSAETLSTFTPSKQEIAVSLSKVIPSDQGTAGPTSEASPKRSPRLDVKRAEGRLTSYRRGAKKPRTEAAKGDQEAQVPSPAPLEANSGAKKRAAALAGRIGTAKGSNGRQGAQKAAEQAPAARSKKQGGKQSRTPTAVEELPSVRCHDARRPSAQFEAACRAGKARADTEGEQQPGSAVAVPQSLAERFADMQRTVMERLTCGAVPSPNHRRPCS